VRCRVQLAGGARPDLHHSPQNNNAFKLHQNGE